MFVAKASHIVIKKLGFGQHKQPGIGKAEFCPCYIMHNKPNGTLIPDRSKPGLSMTAPTAGHWDVGDKYATGVIKVNKI